MTLNDGDVKNLQKLVRSSLLEVNKLKLEVSKLQTENEALKNNDNTDDLKAKFDEDLKNKENEIIDLKNKHANDLKFVNEEVKNLKIKYNDNIDLLKEKCKDAISAKNSKIKYLELSLTSATEKLANAEKELSSKEEVFNNQNNKIAELTNQVSDLKEVNTSLSQMKESLDTEFNNFKSMELNEVTLKLNNALNENVNKQKEIDSLNEALKEAETKVLNIRREFAEYKTEVASNEAKLSIALNSLEEKTAEISKLNLKIDSQRDIITDLKTNLVNKDGLAALQRELDNKDLAIREKEVQIGVLKDQYVSKDEFNLVQNELSKKELQIQRLNEVKDLLLELSDKEPIMSSLDDDIISDISEDDSYLLELNEIKKDLEFAKDNNIKLTSAVPDSDVDNLKEELEKYKSSVEELEKIKVVYDKLTAPQLKGLTSIQSQVYQLLPEEPTDTLAVKEYINSVAFDNLTFNNIKNILKSLEKKGYVKGEINDQDITFWTKLEVEE